MIVNSVGLLVLLGQISTILNSYIVEGGLEMRKLSFIALVGILTALLGGCGGGAETGTDTTVSEAPTPVPVPTTTTAAVPQPPAPSAQPFAQPTTAASPSPAGTLPPDLISSTNPDQRFRSIQRNRPDPFALVPVAPVIERSPTPPQPTAGTPVALAPTAPPQTSPIATAPLPPGNGSLAPIPSLVPNNTIPLPPRAELARAVQVTGVVQVGNAIHAIVKAPNEPTSRYVRAGQYLSNGEILVKRIDVNRAEPVVIFEQDGVEVVVAVGEGGAPADSGTPTASTAGTLPQITASRPF